MFASLADFFAAWSLFRDPTLAGVLAGALLGGLGVYVVLRRLVFLTAAVSQVAGFGVVASHYAALHLGVSGVLASPWLGSGAAALLAVGWLAWVSSRRAEDADATLGVLYLVGAAATLALATRTTAELHDVSTLLFGSAVAVLPADLRALILVAVGLGVLHLVLRRGFVAVVVDAEDARVRGLPTRALDALLLATLAVAVAVVTRVLGALPAFAFSVLPAMAALRLAPSLSAAFVGAVALGAFAGGGGYVLAFLFELPVGAAQALLAALLLMGSAAVAAVVRR
jgi:zinc transport system permease protein